MGSHLAALPVERADVDRAPVDGDRGSVRQSRTFRTRQAADAADFIRTFGTVVSTSSGPLTFRDQDALRYAHPDPPPNCARGKVVALSHDRDGCEAACYQVTDCRTTARVVECCNATAAAAACFTDETRARRVSLRVRLPGNEPVRVEARIGRHNGSSHSTVCQAWNEVPFLVRAETHIDGRDCAVCVSPLNNYLVIRTRPGESAARFGVNEALGLWERFSFVHEPLLSRIAIVEPSHAWTPAVKFFTCGDREHPSAPLSGLAVLAASARRLGWPVLPSTGCVRTPAGLMPLPRVDVLSEGSMRVEFPEVIVDLKQEPA
jgi:hypothetical protein